MKKLLAVILALVCIFSLAGCNSNQSSADISQNQEGTKTDISENEQTDTTDDESAVIMPLPVSVNLEQLEDAIVSISLEKGDFYANENGTFMMDATVFVYDLYDMVDVSLMKEGDTIMLGQKEVVISSVERKDNGCVLVNGGLDNGGFDLYTENNTVYYEQGYSDVKSYYEIGKITLPVSSDFVYTDTSDMDNDAVIMNAEEFLNAEEDMVYYFNANNTTIRIENGEVAELNRKYVP